jgi:UDP-N-acetylglucosamine--N-acetylmuramyl-(pentapeptide) pyrophosphoryl-undecaprenol N-acetylglucosamine transferase
MRIVLTGGGTGGHLIPFEPIVQALRALFVEQKDTLPAWLEPADMELYFLGIADQKTQEFFASYDVPATHIPSGKLRRYASALNISDIFVRLPWGIFTALVAMWRLMPDVVISKGGYGSIPVIVAAIIYRIPILLHESDSVPGLVNRFIQKHASAIAVGLPNEQLEKGKFAYKTIITGTPVRDGLLHVSQSEGKRHFAIPENEFVLLVMGGSQGAKQINEVLLQILPSLIVDVAIIHITGDQNFTAVSTVAKELLESSPRKDLYKPFPYINEDMRFALAAADAVVSRAGATTLAELARMNKACLLIPLAGAAADHQRHNAAIFEAAGAALVLDPINVSKNLFEQNVRRLINEKDTRESLQINMKKMDQPNSARKIAELVFTLAKGLAPAKHKI